MKKIIVILFPLLFAVHYTKAQRIFDVHEIRSFNYSLLISSYQNNIAVNHFSDYGKNSFKNNSSIINSRYLFQSQEFEMHLDLSFFPKRLYDSSTKKFFQPDAKSQYKSSYLFVNSDPINIIDQDGNAGKPLILYGEDYSKPAGVGNTVLDLKSQIKDAYYVPLSDFMNGEVGELPEWEGDVFIKAHMGINGHEVELERGWNEMQFKTESDLVDIMPRSSPEVRAWNAIDGKDLGRKLREFADDRGVIVERITAGGCQGSVAAEKIADGFIEKSAGLGTRKLMTAGLKKGYIALFAGPKSTTFGGEIAGLGHIRYHAYPKGSQKFKAHKIKKAADGRDQFLRYKYGNTIEDAVPMDYMRAKEVRGFLHGQIEGTALENHFDFFPRTY